MPTTMLAVAGDLSSVQCWFCYVYIEHCSNYIILTFKFSIVSSGSLPSISVPSTPAARTASAYRCDASADEHRSDASHVATSSTLLLCVIKG